MDCALQKFLDDTKWGFSQENKPQEKRPAKNSNSMEILDDLDRVLDSALCFLTNMANEDPTVSIPSGFFDGCQEDQTVSIPSGLFSSPQCLLGMAIDRTLHSRIPVQYQINVEKDPRRGINEGRIKFGYTQDLPGGYVPTDDSCSPVPFGPQPYEFMGEEKLKKPAGWRYVPKGREPGDSLYRSHRKCLDQIRPVRSSASMSRIPVQTHFTVERDPRRDVPVFQDPEVSPPVPTSPVIDMSSMAEYPRVCPGTSKIPVLSHFVVEQSLGRGIPGEECVEPPPPPAYLSKTFEECDSEEFPYYPPAYVGDVMERPAIARRREPKSAIYRYINPLEYEYCSDESSLSYASLEEEAQAESSCAPALPTETPKKTRKTVRFSENVMVQLISPNKTTSSSEPSSPEICSPDSSYEQPALPCPPVHEPFTVYSSPEPSTSAQAQEWLRRSQAQNCVSQSQPGSYTYESPQPSTSTKGKPHITTEFTDTGSKISITTRDSTPSGTVSQTITLSQESAPREMTDSERMSRYGTMRKPPRTASTYRLPLVELPPEKPRYQRTEQTIFGPCLPVTYGSTRPSLPKTAAGKFAAVTGKFTPRATSSPRPSPQPRPPRIPQPQRAASVPGIPGRSAHCSRGTSQSRVDSPTPTQRPPPRPIQRPNPRAAQSPSQRGTQSPCQRATATRPSPQCRRESQTTQQRYAGTSRERQQARPTTRVGSPAIDPIRDYRLPPAALELEGEMLDINDQLERLQYDLVSPIVEINETLVSPDIVESLQHSYNRVAQSVDRLQHTIHENSQYGSPGRPC
ncbi:hypothetical protein J6590_075869 [Homalodisca vitripennis]|nr:hypothetical protein J6590_075869 [Homalodisca vitripennis]